MSTTAEVREVWAKSGASPENARVLIAELEAETRRLITAVVKRSKAERDLEAAVRERDEAVALLRENRRHWSEHLDGCEFIDRPHMHKGVDCDERHACTCTIWERTNVFLAKQGASA